jgi:uncharacterized protein
MRQALLDPTTLRRTAETLLIGAIGGIGLNALGVPAGLISGSVIATAVASISGRTLAVPVVLARAVYVLIGIALGSIVTPDTLRGLTAYPFSVAVLVVSTVGMTAATTFYLHKVHRWDLLSALFGASPGALAQVMALSAEAGAEMRAIVIVQSVRVVFLTVGLPSALAVFGLAEFGARRAAPFVPASAFEILILGVVALIPAFLLFRVRFQGGWLFGAMIGSGFLHGSGFIQGGLPWWVYDFAVISMGAVTGARFSNTSRRMLISYFGAALGSFAVAITVAGAFMLMISKMLNVDPASIVIGFAPGAQDTMMVLALSLHLDPVFVGAHHIARYLTVATSIPIAARMIERGRGPAA